MPEKRKPRSLEVFVIVREYKEVKDRLWQEARDNGYSSLSDYVRTFWQHLDEKNTS
jgi:hypothetical protein